MRRASLLSAGAVALAAAAAVWPGAGTALAAPAAGTPAASGPASAHPFTRLCSAVTPAHVMHCNALARTDVRARTGVVPDATPAGYGPADLQSAYKLASTAGGGQTVAIVDAQDDPNAESDLATYRSQYGLPACTTANGCFRKVNQSGAASPLPSPDAGWAGEISLDVDMVSAVCPACRILLVEATSPSTANLGAAVNTAVSMGAKYVSNSYGGGDSTASSAFNHTGVAITASTGDSGYEVEYPASDSHVTAVGGTSLSRAGGTTRGWTESAWSGAGSGCSTIQPKPSWQTSATQCPGKANADVSAVADPNTGVAVYVTYGASGWQVYGGTSASSPIIASVYALAGTPAAGTYPAAYPWSHPSSLFDVTTGSNGSCPTAVWCHAGPGWDGPTGLGTPNGSAAFTSGGGGPPPPGCTAGQVLGNPGFESGNTTWSASSGVIDNSSGEPARSGSYKAWLDGYGSTHTDTLSQSVTVPSGCTSVSFSFWLHIDTAETSTTTAFDTLTVKAGSTTLATYSNLNRNTGYAQKTFTVPGAAGTSVAVSFTGSEDSSLQTSFVVDDAALTVS